MADPSTNNAGEAITVERIELREIRLPLVAPFKISSGQVDERRIVLLELFDTEGASAWSECVAMATPNYSPDTVDTCVLAIRQWVAPRVLGRPFDHPAEVHRWLAVGFQGHAMAKAAVEMGCWGLAAVRRGVSLASLLGGTRQKIATGISLGIQKSPTALAEKVEAALAEGYRKVKIKIAPGTDLDYLQAAHRVAGGGERLMADANSAYTPADREHLRRFDRFGLMMIEQPLAAGDLWRHAELQRWIATPLCLDESITDRQRAEDMIALGAGRIVNLKPGRVGGLAESLAIHSLCHGTGLGLWCGGMLESGVGRAYNVALASLPGFDLPGDVSPSARYWQRDVVDPEWTMDANGHVTVPHDRPGIGVEVDRGRIESLTVHHEVVG